MSCMHAIKKWYSQRSLQQSIPPHCPASSLVFMLSFMLSYLLLQYSFQSQSQSSEITLFPSLFITRLSQSAAVVQKCSCCPDLLVIQSGNTPDILCLIWVIPDFSILNIWWTRDEEKRYACIVLHIQSWYKWGRLLHTHTNEKHTGILTCICIYKDSDLISDNISHWL